MIKIPPVKRNEKHYLWGAILVFFGSIVFLACLAIFAYWYIFGDRDPFAEEKPKPPSNGRLYVNPEYELKNLIRTKLESHE